MDKPELEDTVASRLRYTRFHRGYTISKFAKLSQTTAESIWAIERGKIAHPRNPLLKRMADVLEVSHIWLAGYDLLPESTISEKLHKARLYRLMTMKEAGQFFHVGQRTYFDWEHGKGKIKESYLSDWLSILQTSVQPFIYPADEEDIST